MPSKTAIVIGGGLAGLASAVALAEAGFHVRLLEKRPHLGGRAASYPLPDGTEVDNCQHVTLGCCTNLADFYRRVGAAGKIKNYARLYFLDAQGNRSIIEPSPLPAPFHLATSFASFASLDFRSKRGIAAAMLAILRGGGRPADAEGISMRDWLARHGQTEQAVAHFWRVVLVSALNEELDRADARYGADVFWKAFLSNRRGGVMGIPSVPLGELYGGCLGAVERRGGEVQVRAIVRRILIEEGRVSGIELDDGSRVAGDVYVLAVPHDQVAKLLPEGVAKTDAAIAGLANLRVSPITGVHLWFDRPVMDEPFLTLLDGTVQWIFNKTRLYSTGSAPKKGLAPGAALEQDSSYLQLVISASHELVPRSRQEILEQCRTELLQALPRTREAQVIKATVVKETSATFSPEPGSDRWRPAQVTSIPNLFLAGDWTSTGWPGTMEGAVRSGYRAAEAVLEREGRPAKLIVADLPSEGLTRIWSRG